MSIALRDMPVEERIRMVEDIWDSIAADRKVLTLSAEQRAVLDRRLDAYESDGKQGRLLTEVLADIKQ